MGLSTSRRRNFQDLEYSESARAEEPAHLTHPPPEESIHELPEASQDQVKHPPVSVFSVSSSQTLPGPWKGT